jgi:hypothetical protein
VLSASLYNFDIDDATVKPEHRRWLDTQVIPRLKAEAGATVALRGSASRSGGAAYDRALSARRVDAVRDYLLSQGVQQTQVTTTFTGNDLSTSRNLEDEADRAVFVFLSASLSKSPTFDHAFPGRRYDGFEKPVHRTWISSRQTFGGSLQAKTPPADTADAPSIEPVASQIVPLLPGAGFAMVRVRKAGGMIVESQKPGVARIFGGTSRPTNQMILFRDDELVRIDGISRGDARIAVGPLSGPPVASLEVTTLPARVLKVFFHFVEPRVMPGPNRPPILIGTERKDGDEVSLLAGVNKIYLPQTNIKLELADPGRSRHTVPGLTTGGFVQVNPSGEQTPDEKRVLATRNQTVKLNVWLVGDLVDVSGKTPWIAGLAKMDSLNGVFFRNVILADDFIGEDPQDASVLAHELAHTLGEPDGIAGTLMAGAGLQTQLIPRDMALRMHRSLDQHPG